jgi:hypothetical protein
VTHSPNDLLPFVSYPSQGRMLIGRVRGGNCRHEYGLRHQRLTGQTSCAYCNLDFTLCYENWLMMALDHVIPASVCSSTGIHIEWMDDHANRVLCCAACNGFKNRWTPDEPLACPTTLDGFFDIRDSIFILRRYQILQSHISERRFYEGKPWEIK